MDAFHIVHVEIGPSGIQAESKFSQIGPSPRKDIPRKPLGFPWISLSELSLFKDLRGPLAQKHFRLLSSFQKHRAAMAYAPPRARDAALLLMPGRPMWLRSFITPHYSDDFEP